jgi:adenylate cyclase
MYLYEQASNSNTYSLGLSINQKIKFKITRQFVVVGILLGVIFIFFANGTSEFYPFINGALIGSLAGLLIAVLELFLFARGAKKIKFIWLLIIRSLIYVVLITGIILLVVVGSRIIRLNQNFSEVLQSQNFQYYIKDGNFSVALVYALTFAFSINFVRMISRKMGQGMLVSYINGTYYAPVHQARIVMFIDIINSKGIINKLGHLKFHKFLNEFYYDISVPTVTHRGIIYEYIENLMVITWAMNKGLENANCIRTYFGINEILNEKKEKYLEKYGFTPQVEGSLHTGSVVRAEIGEVKTQIVFHGDTMNTTARILGKCKELKVGLLASDQLIHMIGMPRIYSKKSVGKMNLKGKQISLNIFEILEKTGTGA